MFESQNWTFFLYHATIREQGTKKPSNFDSNVNATLRLLLIVLLKQLYCDYSGVSFVGALKRSLEVCGSLEKEPRG